MSVTTRAFARHEGQDIVEATLESDKARISVLSWGCVLRDWRARAPGGGADEIPVTLGFDRFEDYINHSRSFGIIAGRVANRIANARFMLEGREIRLAANSGAHHIHGGESGLGRRNWRLDTDSAATAIRLTRHSPDGEDRYPGAVDFSVTMRLDGAELAFEMEGRPDRLTPINLAQHSYWNLDGDGDVRDHRLLIRADCWTPADAALIPSGEIASVAGTPVDFRVARRMTSAGGALTPLDVNLVLEAGHDPAVPAATVWAGRSGLRLDLWTDQPGVQIYNASNLEAPVPGLGGRRYEPFAGLCLEAQHFPDSVNHPEFPSILCDPDRPYRQVTAVRIA